MSDARSYESTKTSNIPLIRKKTVGDKLNLRKTGKKEETPCEKRPLQRKLSY
jgi:hypothetical protein